ncbi:MAG: GGDEF domain-containing protein [Methylophilaceae bacterium]
MYYLQLLRQNDTLIRWGGEEFVVVALEVSEQSLVTLCEKLRTQIEHEVYGNAKEITVSIGATLFRKDDTQSTLISRADQALYTAKEKGRNMSIFVQ